MEPSGVVKKRMDITYWSTETRELRDHQRHYGKDEPGAAENPHNPSERSIIRPTFFQFFLPQSFQPNKNRRFMMFIHVINFSP